jgi:hypothetical protein
MPVEVGAAAPVDLPRAWPGAGELPSISDEIAALIAKQGAGGIAGAAGKRVETPETITDEELAARAGAVDIFDPLVGEAEGRVTEQPGVVRTATRAGEGSDLEAVAAALAALFGA